MKTTTFFILAMIVFANTNGQNYIPFPTENTVWNYQSGDPESVYNTLQEITGDTSINNISYTVLKIITVQFNPLIPIDTTTSYNFVREENKKIYTYDSDNALEYVLYDFNLDSADLFSTYPGTTDTLVVYNKDSVILNNGQYRNRIKLMGSIGGDTLYDNWVEGIGRTSRYFWEAGESLTCFTTGNVNLISDSCFYLDVKNPLPKQKLSISPNPANDYINIENISDQYKTLEILNINGQVITKYSISADNNKINISALPKGLYILRFTGQNDVFVDKIVKY
ncbi:MAG: T9SS type A sorting domain-containing protein [Bacteroidia bacterium]|nr:T9SS type A sorting domain-containing protein [Bacteroidia bacterium]